MKVDLPRLIERWENGLRVLQSMDEHERRKHFNMRLWGEKTDCGTLACAAGHMSLDPWFRKRGFCSLWETGRDVWRHVAILSPTRDRSWAKMINEFFYVDPRIEGEVESGYAKELLPDQELQVLAAQAVQVFYGDEMQYGRVIKHIEGTISRLKEYRDRVKKEEIITLPLG